MKIKYLSICFLLLVFSSCNRTVQDTLVIVDLPDVMVFFLAGQSNMAGSANYDALDSMTKKRIEKAAEIVNISNDGKASKPLSPSYSKYQKNKRGFGNVFGPEIPIGLTLAEMYPEQEILLIKKAQGGTALQGAWNPEWTAEKAAEVEKEGFKRELQLYRDHHIQIKEQLAIIKQDGKSYKVMGMFWMQGENDAAKELGAINYEVNLKKLIAGYRVEFDVPDMPFVMGQINSSYGKFKEGPEMVRAAMVAVSNNDKNVGVVKTSMDRSWSDYPKHDDNVHYNHIGQMRLGIAFTKLWGKIKE